MPKPSSLSELKRSRYYKITELAAASGIPASSIRAAFTRNELAGIRTRPACNAPIRIKTEHFFTWLESCSENHRVLSPADAAQANREFHETTPAVSLAVESVNA